MSRTRTPDGRRVPVSFKLTEDEAALVDALRGDTERGPWLRGMALEAARRLQDSGIPESTARDRRARVAEALLDDAAALAEPAARPRAKHPCEHRVPPGSYCTRCKRLI